MTGIYNLGDAAIAQAVTDLIITEGVSTSGTPQALIDRLEGMSAVSLQASLVYGSGGTACVVVVQTSLDQGQSWIDVARFDFAQASAKKIASVSAMVAAAPAPVAALGAEGKLDGILGDRLRAKVTSSGTYGGNTSISVRAAVR
ncbi:hypothetical protein [Shinella pollutisoli]|uniref:Uncharacterized protein n=1 Tax=Shinella pollutisoli TaxID=2250594 RepID=A0ABV7D9Z5_9HYPH|nr:hypothetical protein [Shinella pollutisoli]